VKIAFVSDAIYPYNKGGKEKRLYELSTRLAKLGHDVHIYTMHWWDTPEKTRTEDGVQLHAICKLYDMYNGERRSIKEGLLFGFACLKLIRVKADVFDIDHMPFFPIYSAWLVVRLRGRKLFGTWHEVLTRQDWIDYMGKAGIIAWMVEYVSIRLPNHITAVSTRTYGLLETMHARKKISLVTPGIDTTLIKRIKPANIICDVLYIGRFVKDKNVDKLIRAVSLIAKENPQIRCVVIGHGVEKTRLEKLIKQLGVTKQVIMLEPLQNSEDILSYMKATKVFCLPSVREGFGIVALEALGCGTPVITIDTPANAAKDLINSDNGSLVPPEPSAIANAINQWIKKSKPQDIASAVNNYDWNSIARHQAKVYAA
jgi:glycosyltransferase involved in cell wall biosynthesis